MVGSINKVILVGNLGREPEIRVTATGQKIANFPIATSDTWKDKSGERQEKTEWHRVVIFSSALSEVAEKYLRKGSKVYIEGALQTRKYTDASGQEKYITEVVLGAYRGEMVILDGRSGGEISTNVTTDNQETSGWDTAAAGDAQTFDDEIPF